MNLLGFSRKKAMPEIKVPAPKLPYRVLSDSEKDLLGSYVYSLSYEDREKFWRQTIPDARKVIGMIRDGGFPVGKEMEWGGELYVDRADVNIYPKNYQTPGGVGPVESLDREKIIGSVSLWKFGGFLLNPVSVWYENKGLVEESITLRDYLLERGIPFRDGVSMVRLNDSLEHLRNEVAETEGLIKRLSGIDLRA